MVKNKKALRRNKIRRRIRSTITGTSERPRLAVFKSSKHIYAQIIDDTAAVTLVSASTIGKDLTEAAAGKTGIERAGVIGEAIAKKAIEKGIVNIVFDRGGYKYHGQIKSLAEAARQAGLNF